MAKLVLQLLLLTCVVYLTAASVAIALPNPKYPGQCYDGKHAYNVGIHYPPNKCMRLSCNEDFIMEFESCGSIGVPSGYKNLPDYTKKYPECCENVVRVEDQENIIE